MMKKPKVIKWHGGDKGNKLLNAQIGILKVQAVNWEETDRRCIAYGGVIETIEQIIVECDL